MYNINTIRLIYIYFYPFLLLFDEHMLKQLMLPQTPDPLASLLADLRPCRSLRRCLVALCCRMADHVLAMA